MKHPFFSLNPDLAGFSVSLLCAAHCAALPLLLSLAPLSGLHFLAHPWAELAVICLSILLALFALLKGYYNHHRRKTAPIVAILGFLLIGTGHMAAGELQEIVFSTSGAVFIALAHFINRRHIQEAASRITDQTASA